MCTRIQQRKKPPFSPRNIWHLISFRLAARASGPRTEAAYRGVGSRQLTGRKHTTCSVRQSVPQVMSKLRQKIRNVFSWQHDDYTFEPVPESAQSSGPPLPLPPPKESKSNRFLKAGSSPSKAVVCATSAPKSVAVVTSWQTLSALAPCVTFFFIALRGWGAQSM